MVMLPGPLAGALRSLGYGRPDGETGGRSGQLLSMNPAGELFNQKMAFDLSSQERLTLICGRYEGIDARIEEIFPVRNVCIGDFILNGGEAAAMCIIESVARLLPGFMGHEQSGTEESFSSGLLEYPHYTRPESFEGLDVPEILRSGDHGAIARWRRRESLRRTVEKRPDLLLEAETCSEDLEFLKGITRRKLGRNLYCALVHHPVLDKFKKISTVSLTNLDIHDIGRSSCTYELGGYFVLTPLKDQRDLLDQILQHWTAGAGGRVNPARATALAKIRAGDRIEDAVSEVARLSGQKPLIVASTARQGKKTPPVVGYAKLRDMLSVTPVLLLFGTGHGLAPEALKMCDAVLPPVRGFSPYNHLSVRSAAAIIFDRILKDAH